MTEFNTIQEAKDYLAGKIAEQAKREGVPLTEVERKMLYFTETGWTLPDMMAVGAEFDRDYDRDAYERKIAGLVRGIQARQDADTEKERDLVSGSIETLRGGPLFTRIDRLCFFGWKLCSFAVGSAGALAPGLGWSGSTTSWRPEEVDSSVSGVWCDHSSHPGAFVGLSVKGSSQAV